MNKTDIKRLLVLLKAVQDGKTLEYHAGSTWGRCDEVSLRKLAIYPEDYRVAKEKKYVPFESAKECIGEINKKPGNWIRLKDSDSYYYIVSISNDGVEITSRDESNLYNFEYCLENFVFSDNQPFGKESVDDNEE